MIQKLEQEVQVVEKGSPVEQTGLTHVFEEGVQNKARYDCQQYIPKWTGKKHLGDKFTQGRYFVNLLSF